MQRFKIEEQANTHLKTKSWFLRLIWPKIKEEIIDLFFVLLQEAKAELLERLEKEIEKKRSKV